MSRTSRSRLDTMTKGEWICLAPGGHIEVWEGECGLKKNGGYRKAGDEEEVVVRQESGVKGEVGIYCGLEKTFEPIFRFFNLLNGLSI